MKTVEETTVKKDMCINCGICATVCPVEAIDMRPNEFREVCPVINREKCTKCGLCAKFCPHTADKMLDEATKIAQSADPISYGITDARYYLAYNTDVGVRAKSASGGVITGLAIELLERGIIDGVVHGKRLFAQRGERHFAACVSTTKEEILNRSSSIYAPLDFHDVLKELEIGKTYLITGTPCVINAVRRLFSEHPKYKKIKIYTCALICSHNVSELYADFLGQYNKVNGNEKYAVNYRNKEGIFDANNFNTHFYTAERDLLKKNRFLSYFTETWRNYAFAMNVCCYCSDLYGRYADVSVKDAWGKEASDPLGKSYCIVRNNQLNDTLCNAERIHVEPVEFDTIRSNQYPQAEFKQAQALNKLKKSRFSKENRNNGLFRTTLLSRLSKYSYVHFGYKITKRLIRLLIGKCEGVKNLSYRSPFSERPAFNHRTKKVITVIGGYGNGNVGDEAQNNETLQLLKKRYPEYQILNLTPAPDYSFVQHPGFYHDFAGRNLFYNLGNKKNCYFLTGFRDKLRFLFTSLLVLLNARFVKKNRPVWFINAQKAKMLQNLKESSLLYFCGGGYLTGSTLSRLWEGILLCRICKIFRVPVVMSGQTIGVWPGKFTKKWARKAFRKVKLITLRDNAASIADLAKIGVTGEHIFATHDDALFCDKSEQRQVEESDYISFNFHFWGMQEKDKIATIEKVHKIVSYLLQKTESRIIFIPMHSSDEECFDEYIEKYPEDRLVCYKYDYDFRKIRRVIADSSMCITMKHHPIIFAMGENVPVISLAFSQYYVHKNKGALEQYGQEQCSANFEDDDWYEQFLRIYGHITQGKNVVEEIRRHKVILKQAKEKFLCGVDEILKLK